MAKLKNVNELKYTKMNKIKILKLYIADLTNLVKDSDARGNRLAMLEDELEKQQGKVNVTLGSVSKKQLEEQKKIAYDKGFYDGCDHAAPSF